MARDTIKAASLDEAVAIANELKAQGKFNWFRGQRRNWRVKSSCCRLEQPNEIRMAEAKLKRFFRWVYSTLGMEELASDNIKAWAVAQHYGLPTNLLDFTTDPDVAGVFATESEVVSPKCEGCIVCLNTGAIEAFAESHFPRATTPSNKRIALVTVTVGNLWRLEAQRGVFLYCPYSNADELLRLDRIVFPAGAKRSGMTFRDVMPSRKSSLEILLDQYFMQEKLISGNAAIEEFIAVNDIKVFRVERAETPWDPTLLVDAEPPGIHESWETARTSGWMTQPIEPYTSTALLNSIELAADSSLLPNRLLESIASQTLDAILRTPGIRNAPTKIILSPCDMTEPADSERISRVLCEQWDGMRKLPYSDHQIAQATGMLVVLELSEHNKKWSSGDYRILQDVMGPHTCLEFGSTDSAYSRGYVSNALLGDAMRRDLVGFLSPEHVTRLTRSPKAIFEVLRDPSRLFVFEKIAEMFATQVIPTQLWLRQGSAIFYSPARLTVLGEA